VSRCVPFKDTWLPEQIPTFCAMAIARIGELPRTLESRSIVIRMRRAAPDEELTKIKSEHREALKRLNERIVKWASNGGRARVGDKTLRGYEQTQFEEVWSRYIDTPGKSAHLGSEPATPQQVCNFNRI
jgi:hypothetical protein